MRDINNTSRKNVFAPNRQNALPYTDRTSRKKVVQSKKGWSSAMQYCQGPMIYGMGLWTYKHKANELKYRNTP